MEIESPSMAAPVPPKASVTELPPISSPFIDEFQFDVTERERRFATAYVEASVELTCDDNNAAVLAYFRAFPYAVVDELAARKLARFLLRRPAVKQMIHHMRLGLSTRAMIPVSRLVEELERIGYANIADFGRVDAKGQLRIDLSRASYRSLAGVNEVEVKERIIKSEVINKQAVLEEHSDPEVETVVQRTTKIKLNKLEALDRLAKIHGLYSEGNLDPAAALEFLDRAISRVKSRMASPVIEQQAAP